MQEKFYFEQKKLPSSAVPTYSPPLNVSEAKEMPARPDDIPEVPSPGDGDTDCRKEEGWRQHRRVAGPPSPGFSAAI